MPTQWMEYFFSFKELWEKKEEVACGGGTNDRPFVCCWGLEMEEGKKREGLDAARLYWPHRKHVMYLRCHIGEYARASTAYVVHA